MEHFVFRLHLNVYEFFSSLPLPNNQLNQILGILHSRIYQSMPNSPQPIQVHLLNITLVLLRPQDNIHLDTLDHLHLTKDIHLSKEVHPTKT